MTSSSASIFPKLYQTSFQFFIHKRSQAKSVLLTRAFYVQIEGRNEQLALWPNISWFGYVFREQVDLKTQRLKKRKARFMLFWA